MAFSAYVEAFYKVENNGLDATANGRHCGQTGTPTYNNTYFKYGSYSVNGGSAVSNFLNPPASIETVLGALVSGGYTIQFWVRNNGNNNYSHFFAKKADANTTGSILFSCNGTGGVYGTCVQLKWNGSTDRVIPALYNQPTDTQTWIRYNLEYDITNDQLKVYKNGALGYTLNSAGNPFATNDGVLKIGSSNFSNCDGQLDNIAFASQLMGGAEITEITAPIPTSCTPNTGTTLGGTTVAIAGTNFVSGCTVTFGGTSATNVIFGSSTSITCDTPAHAAGAVNVVVTNPDTQTGTITNGFTYIAPPNITSVDPISGPVTGGTPCTLRGTDFASGADITINGVSQNNIVFINSTELTFDTVATVAGTYSIVVTNPDMQTDTLTNAFTFTPINDIHFTSSVKEQDFTIFLTDTDITRYQKEPYQRNEELNVIDTFDFAFDTVKAKAPLEFFKFLSNKAVNTLKVKDKKNNTIYIGNVSGVKSNISVDFSNKSIEIESSPLIEDISTKVAIYDIAATNPVKVLKQLLDASVNSQYTVSKVFGLASILPDINISVDTDGNSENTRSIIQSICEYFNIGVYLDGLTVKAYVAQPFPDTATDIVPYLVNGQPKFTSRGDLYADKIMLSYKPSVGGTEASVTSGTGSVVKKISVSDPIFMDATSAQATADRALSIYSQDLYESEFDVDKTALFELGDLIKYASELGNFICLIIGKETTRNQITYRVLGVLK